MFSRVLCVLLCLAAPCAAETWVADFEAYNTRRQDMMSGDEYGPFTWSGGVAMNYPGRGFAAEGDSFVKVSSPKEYGPLTIYTDAPARLDGGWFSGSRSVGIIADWDGISIDENDRVTYFPTQWTWDYVDLNISFLRSLTIVGCEPHGSPSDFECFWNDEVWSSANVDALDFSVAIAQEIDAPNGPDDLPPDFNNTIPEPPSVVLFSLASIAGFVALRRFI